MSNLTELKQRARDAESRADWMEASRLHLRCANISLRRAEFCVYVSLAASAVALTLLVVSVFA